MTDGVKKAMEKFYASKKAQELPKVKKKKSKSTELTEEQIQNRVVTAMRKLGLFVFHTPLNAGGRADAIQASRDKRMGALRGTPDLVILDAPVEYKGVFWEIKKPKGRISPEQVDFMEKASALGWLCICCKGLQPNLDALEIIYGKQAGTREEIIESLRETEGVHIVGQLLQ